MMSVGYIVSTTGDVQYTGLSIQIQSPPPSVLMMSPGVLNNPHCTAHSQCTYAGWKYDLETK